MFALVEKLLISRSPTSASVIFICVGHQLAAEGHIRLIRQAVLIRTRQGRESDQIAASGCFPHRNYGQDYANQKARWAHCRYWLG